MEVALAVREVDKLGGLLTKPVPSASLQP